MTTPDRRTTAADTAPDAAAATAADATRADESGERDFRDLMSLFPTGVAVISTMDEAGRPWGMTCSSLCSVALKPPTLLVCVRSGSPTLAALTRAGRFAVNVLHHGARDVAELFASGDPDRFRRTPWCLPAAAGGPHLRDAANAVGDCRVVSAQQAGDHTVVFARVCRASVAAPGNPPLIYGMRQYIAWPSDMVQRHPTI